MSLKRLNWYDFNRRTAVTGDYGLCTVPDGCRNRRGIFFIRFCLTLKRMEMQLEILGKAVNASLSPAVEEFRETSSKFRELIDTLQGSVSNFAMIAMMKKVSPKDCRHQAGLGPCNEGL